MTYYHGTNRETAEMLDNGSDWMGSEFSDFTDGFTKFDGEGVVFLTDSIEEAREYGEAVIVVKVDGAEFFQEAPYSSAKEYVVDVNLLNDSGTWWLVGEE